MSDISKIEKNQFHNLTVYYANQLARMNSKFTLEEEKVMHLVISQIKPYEKNPNIFKLSKLDFFNKLELESKNRYPRYRQLIQGLIKKTFVEITDIDGEELMGVVVTASKWHKKQSFFEIEISKMFMPFLEQLVRDYTQVNLDTILKFNSKHTLNLYKWLCSWSDDKVLTKGSRYIMTKDLKELFGLTKEAYVQNGKFNRADFERRTVNPAIEEINSKSNLTVYYRKNKKGNRVLNYNFSWKNMQIVKSLEINKSNQIQNTMPKKQINDILINIDKDSEVIFDK